MTNTPRLSRSGIEYLTHEWGFFSGCHHKQLGLCPAEFNCWAETITRRFKGHYPKGFEPTFYPEAFLSPLHLKKPARIGCAFMGDLFMDEISPDLNLAAVELASSMDGKTHLLLPNVPLRKAIFTTVELCPQHTFVFLTKNPKGLLKWSPFPDNCWAGFSACNREMLRAGCRVMREVEARVKFVSIEPMLEDAWCLSSTLVLAGISLVIIGAQTKPYKPPELEWVEFMVDAADKAGAKVFLKNNLLPAFQAAGITQRDDWTGLRQEVPA